MSEVEGLTRQHIKHSTLPEDAYTYIAKLIMEDAPKNAAEMFALIGDFLTDGMVYNEDDAFKVCEVI